MCHTYIGLQFPEAPVLRPICFTPFLFNALANIHFLIYTLIIGLGYAVAQLVEAQRYKPEVRGLDSRWGP
jgi:hypothetical protein